MTLTQATTVRGMTCSFCGRRRLLPWACGRCRRDRRRMRRDYLRRAAPQDALTDMTIPPDGATRP